MRLGKIPYIEPLPDTPETQKLDSQLSTPEGRKTLAQTIPQGQLVAPYLLQGLEPEVALSWANAWKLVNTYPALLWLGLQGIAAVLGGITAGMGALLFFGGAEIGLPSNWFATFVAFWFLTLAALWLVANTSTRVSRMCHAVAHPWLGLCAGVLIGWFLALRTTWLMTIGAMALFAFAYILLTHPLRRTFAPLALFAALTAWALVSGIASYWRERAHRATPSEDQRRAVREQRAEWAHKAGHRIAVALSGGGYRAAAIHAGVLSVLDEARTPIQILSTVSGGSIVGAAYESGWTPSQFKDYLVQSRPGLVRDYLHIARLSAELWGPSYNSGDTLDRHLSEAFFGTIALSGTGPGRLVVNSTDYATGGRKIFSNTGPGNGYPLSRVVAASAAFPVAFDPVTIDGRPYVDGGIVENLGVEGLAMFLRDQVNEPTPDILIVSDASASPSGVTGRKFLPSDQFLRVLDLVYAQLHKKIFALLSGSRYAPNASMRPEQPYLVDASVLWPGRSGTVRVVILAPTSQAETSLFAGNRDDAAMVERVRKIGTLAEPSPEEVTDAFKAGALIARAYLPAFQ